MQEQAGRIADLVDALLAQLEASHLVGRTESVLDAADHAQRGVLVAFEVQNHVYEMLERARTRLRQAGLLKQAILHEARMEDAASAPGSPFGVVAFSLNALMHLDTPDAQRTALTAARKATKLGGITVIDTMKQPFPELVPAQSHILHDMQVEEQRFDHTLREGLVAAMRTQAMMRLPAEALTALLAAAFDRAALAVEAGAPAEDYRAVLIALMDGLSPAPPRSTRPAASR